MSEAEIKSELTRLAAVTADHSPICRCGECLTLVELFEQHARMEMARVDGHAATAI
jgi:hypothetical protein